MHRPIKETTDSTSIITKLKPINEHTMHKHINKYGTKCAGLRSWYTAIFSEFPDIFTNFQRPIHIVSRTFLNALTQTRSTGGDQKRRKSHISWNTFGSYDAMILTSYETYEGKFRTGHIEGDFKNLQGNRQFSKKRNPTLTKLRL